MNRQEVYELIEAERLEQNAVWKDRSQYKKSAPHILVLDGQLAKLKSDWYGATKDALKSRFIKMAAIAVRALEEIE
jgi:hypothetical protein